MGKFNYHINPGIIFLIYFLFVLACDKNIQESGFLEGKISIGPLCPVEHDPPDPGCLPTAETYKAYPVGIFSSDRKHKITQVNPALDGTFRIDLDPGKYLVILESEHFRIGSSNLPAEVVIISQNKTILDIDIDTGIR
ncbi:MAG: hypothetical protein NTY95_02890 [Bacteroidia bacterium]|nr:hypothetical protein [Bacteroidia bacterium]